MAEKSLRRLPLRQLLANSDKTTRELAEHVQAHLMPRLVDLRELSRPVRRKSHYPTVMAFQNGLRHVLEANDQLQGMINSLQEHLEAIRDHAQSQKSKSKG